MLLSHAEVRRRGATRHSQFSIRYLAQGTQRAHPTSLYGANGAVQSPIERPPRRVPILWQASGDSTLHRRSLLRLAGCDRNRHGNVGSVKRYIVFHKKPHDYHQVAMGDVYEPAYSAVGMIPFTAIRLGWALALLGMRTVKIPLALVALI